MGEYDRTIASARPSVARSAASRELRATLEALRPRQWTKNLLVFAGIVFAGDIGDPHKWLAAVAAFVAYCAASSAGYLVNDLRDAPFDRLHPVKRLRPIASGRLARGRALALAACLWLLAFAVAAVLGAASALLLAIFVSVQIAYTLALKRIPGVDVVAIASLFALRAAAGAAAIDVPISPWLLACTALLALFLALAKRREELVARGHASRPALARYSVPALDRALTLTAVATVVTYSWYAITVRTPALALSIPFVVLGLGRYRRLIGTRSAGEEPESVLLRDRPIAAAVVGWIVTCAVIVAVT